MEEKGCHQQIRMRNFERCDEGDLLILCSHNISHSFNYLFNMRLNTFRNLTIKVIDIFKILISSRMGRRCGGIQK